MATETLLFDALNLKTVSFAQLHIIHDYLLPVLLNLNHKMSFKFSLLIPYILTFRAQYYWFPYLIGSVGK